MEVYLACFPVQGKYELSSDGSSGDGAFYSIFTNSSSSFCCLDGCL